MKLSEKLATIHSIEELSQSLSVLETLDNEKGLLLNENTELIREAVKLKTEGLIYLFSGYDEMSIDGFGGEVEGHAIYQKLGDRLLYLLDNAHSTLDNENNIIKYLKDNNIDTIYTGEIIDNFLGLEANSVIGDLEDHEKETEEDGTIIEPTTHMITRCKLNGWMINFLREKNIEVKELKKLI